MMWKYGADDAGRAHAEKTARENELCYGWSVFTAGWFVGTAKELSAIGVIAPLHAISLAQGEQG